MSTPQPFPILRSESITSPPPAPNSPLTSETYHMSDDTPSVYYSTETWSGAAPTMQHSLAATSTPHLLPSPTWHVGPDSTDDNSSLTALYTAVVLCAVLAAVMLILVAVVVVLMCRRHSRQRRTKTLCSPQSDPNSPKELHNRSQHSFSGCESPTVGEVKVGVVSFTGSGDIRSGSESETLKGSIDTRSSASREPSMSTEKSNCSVSRKNSVHIYTEIETMSHSDSTHSQLSHTPHVSVDDSIHQFSGNGSVPVSAPVVIPPPPNKRTRREMSPHFYYVLERLEDCKEEEYGKERLKGPWELGMWEEGHKKSRSRDGSTKSRSESLKRELSTCIYTDVHWGDVRMRARSGSCPSKELRGDILKRGAFSREGSSKSSRSHEGSVKNTTSTTNTSSRAAGAVEVREGSIRSRGSRESSVKKEVIVPIRQSEEKESRKEEKRVLPTSDDYDVLEPIDLSYPQYSLINEGYFSMRGVGLIFDDPKYAAVSLGNLPQLANQHHHHHQSLDPILPWRMQAGVRGGGLNAAKAISSKSLQGTGLGNVEVQSSIYHQTHGSAPNHGMSIGVNAPSRLSMPFDAYYS